MKIEIVTNNKPRLLIDAYQLTEKERAEFDYLDWEAIDSGNDSATFFRYKGQLYDIGEFMSAENFLELQGWLVLDRIKKTMFKLICQIMADNKKEKTSPFASWSLINCKEFDNVIWG